MKVQALSFARVAQPVAARRGRIGIVWANVIARPRRRAVAERVAQMARVDHPDTIIRVRA